MTNAALRQTAHAKKLQGEFGSLPVRAMISLRSCNHWPAREDRPELGREWDVKSDISMP